MDLKIVSLDGHTYTDNFQNVTNEKGDILDTDGLTIKYTANKLDMKKRESFKALTEKAKKKATSSATGGAKSDATGGATGGAKSGATGGAKHNAFTLNIQKKEKLENCTFRILNTDMAIIEKYAKKHHIKKGECIREILKTFIRENNLKGSK